MEIKQGIASSTTWSVGQLEGRFSKWCAAPGKLLIFSEPGYEAQEIREFNR